MAEYVEVNGVDTWYDEQGDGDPLVLLHGGLTDSRDFAPNLGTLADRFRVLTPDRRGHGRTADVPGPITMELMAADTIAFLEKVIGTPSRLVGYSAGAAVALAVGRQRPDLVERLVLISGAFRKDGMIMTPQAGMEPPPHLIDAYAEVSPDGRDHFPVVVDKVATAFEAGDDLTEEDLGAVPCRTLVMSGDDDLVTLEHTIALYRGLPNAQLSIVPETSHLLLFEKPKTCTRIVSDFLTSDPSPTYMPIRRS
ncbi:pimeloyl-ACP methyl ester carboxylesterase [Herbihabitans rhizosphaerae]|uniref:Pimeloyl-ACP methyl ester carboxylesterase n=1 Tax=Herbihabitans rhizosphaerae TaxID=1872711 RepID=A0A4Q7KFZ2_9PSEU|nr:alpha/beta hydrolase [Herbihabitans rhizosphaerae]RZS32823.1 pimeloyl-ACP methyl ester carboxylesterase [Herbihabitans rhizosphaerae]